MIKIGIIGITGFTGEELLKILLKHKNVKISVLQGRTSSEVKPLKQIYPNLSQIDINCEPLDIKGLSDKCDVVFLALPHRISFEIVPEIIKAGKKVIDLSADFRLNDGQIYEKWYGSKHTATHLLTEAVYGLPEIYREKIKKAKLIANPGCYPTSVILACAPAMKKNIVESSSLIVDSKSGISGAGRKAAEEYFQKEHPNFRAYNIGGIHRHIPEIEQELSKVVGEKVVLTFTPHIIPIERGMLSTIYLDLKKKISTADIISLYSEFYKNEPFVRVLKEGELPSTKNVVNTNFCEIGLKVDDRINRLIVISAIDNLIKGASGQAVQNMNIMFNLGEEEGLK
ncbi:MAG: N-acetyl-gamma-glutamyl-phosphate reductase [Elusimicrobia bacterium]|nr:N-acetyl-gamma-glutamyl-phosphate reductase [Elusimicrobiota bacterium]